MFFLPTEPDSAPRDGDVMSDARHDRNDVRAPLGEDHGTNGRSTQERSWEHWSGNWPPGQWGHSEWNGKSGWSQAGWVQSGTKWTRRDGHECGHGDDRRWSYGGTWGSSTSSTGDGSGLDGRGPGDGAWMPRTQNCGWQPEKRVTAGYDGSGGPVGPRAPSEKMVVPTFSGELDKESSDDIGTTARSYLRQIAAWRRMTRLSPEQQGLTVYQHLSGRAWVDAERLDMDMLSAHDGLDYFIEWVRDRYLDVEVTQVGRSLSTFRKLHRRPTQSIRDYTAEYDRALARLHETGCVLPDLAAAWVYLDRMSLDETSEISLLASVGNKYQLKSLQQAALVQDRSLRKPWEGAANNKTAPRKDWWSSRKPQTVNMADGDAFLDEDTNDNDFGAEAIPEEIAQDLYESFMTHETAKQRYRESAKLRGNDPESMKALAAERLRIAKERSYCGKCKRRGHCICPLNRGSAPTPEKGNGGGDAVRPGGDDRPTRNNFPCHVVHVTWDLNEKLPSGLLAILDTACSRSVAGIQWIEGYLTEARTLGYEPQVLSSQESFKFGASRVFESTYSVVIHFLLGSYMIGLRVAVVYGDVPLLVSRPALGTLGTVMDIALNTATFKKAGVYDLPLKITETGHPALPLKPVNPQEIQIASQSPQYTAYVLESVSGSCQDGVPQSRTDVGSSYSGPVVDPDPEPQLNHGYQAKTNTPSNVFFPKKITPATRNMLLSDKLNPETFLNWWSQSPISNDFWIEGEYTMVRVHVVPRRTFFSPECWNTDKVQQKTNLLESLGSMRIVNAISCKTHRGISCCPRDVAWE